MRIESSVTALSWIPSEAVAGSMKLGFDSGVAHYDEPPPDVVGDLDALRRADRFRFANVLSAWVDVEDGRIAAYASHEGRGMIGSTIMRLGGRQMTFRATQLPDLVPEPQATEAEVRFVQTSGGRTGVPVPRRVRRKPFVQFRAPLAWTTLELVIRADGSSDAALVGASPFPRHWVYDHSGKLMAKTGLIDFSSWFRRSFGKHSPWGDEDSPALTAQLETALERELSLHVMRSGAKPEIRKVKQGVTVTVQGESGNELFLILDGIVRVEVDGERIAEYGPGSLHGERAVLAGGRRTSTVRAVTPSKLAVVPADKVERTALVELSGGHRREDQR